MHRGKYSEHVPYSPCPKSLSSVCYSSATLLPHPKCRSCSLLDTICFIPIKIKYQEWKITGVEMEQDIRTGR